MAKKVSVENFENKNKQLYTINEMQSLSDTIKNLCEQFSLSEPEKYGLKLLQTNDGKNIDTYLTDENYYSIKDGYFLKLVYSLEYLIKIIFGNENIITREEKFRRLNELSTDAGFITELVKQKQHFQIVTFITADLKGEELEACLITFLHLIQKKHIKYFHEITLDKIIGIVSEPQKFEDEQVAYGLAVLCQILYLKDKEFTEVKIHIISNLSIQKLIVFVEKKESSSLQLNTLMLMNALVRYVSGEKRRNFIKEMNLKENKERIFNYVIKEKLKQEVEHELYVYQTYILSLLADALSPDVDIISNPLFRREEYEIYEDIERPTSNFMDFEEKQMSSRNNSYGSILDVVDNERFSLASISTRQSAATCDSIFSILSTSIEDVNTEPHNICHLTLEGLRYYKGHYEKNFEQSLIEEKTYEPGIYKTSETVVQMLARLLHVDKDPVKNYYLYQPLIFKGDSKSTFFFELFCRTMWLLSKTRREMKVNTVDDYKKVLKVLEQQVVIVLNKKITDYKTLTNEFKNITYKEVANVWQQKYDNEWETILATNPCVQEFKKSVIPANEKLIYQQRISVLQNGAAFPKLNEKKNKSTFFMRLGKNCKKIFWGDWDEELKKFTINENKLNTFNITDIKYFIVGKACPHVKDNSVKDPNLAFTIQLENNEIINFYAKNEKTAHKWTDAFHLLLDKPIRSKTYKKDLDRLVKMDCMLQLIELQNVKIPDKPPPIPALPPTLRIKPIIPPKPDLLKRKSKRLPSK